MEQIRLRKHSLIAELNRTGPKSWEEVLEGVVPDAEQSDKGVQAAKKVLTILKSISSNLEPLPKPANAYKKEGLEMARAQVEQIRDILNKSIMPSLPDGTMGYSPTELCEQIYDPVVADQLIKLEAAVEVRLDKAFSRLVALKAHKRLMAST